MDESEPALHRHYHAQQLAPARVKAILAAGSAAAKRRARLRYWTFAAAAAVLLSFSGWFLGFRPTPSAEGVTLPAVAAAIVDYFSKPAPTLAVVSEDRTRLKQWLGTKGAPTQFVIPPTLARLRSVGCEVLDVRGQHVALLCFFLEPAPLETAGTTGAAGATSPSSGPKADSGPQLVHLMVVARSAMRDTPRAGQIVQLDPVGQWKVIAWSQDDLVYFAASDVSGLRLSDFASAL